MSDDDADGALSFFKQKRWIDHLTFGGTLTLTASGVEHAERNRARRDRGRDTTPSLHLTIAELRQVEAALVQLDRAEPPTASRAVSQSLVFYGAVTLGDGAKHAFEAAAVPARYGFFREYVAWVLDIGWVAASNGESPATQSAEANGRQREDRHADKDVRRQQPMSSKSFSSPCPRLGPIHRCGRAADLDRHHQHPCCSR